MAAFQVMSTNEDCGAMQIIVRSTFIRSSFLIRSVLSIIGIAVTATIFKIRGDYMCFHPNARILLHAFVLWNFILSISLLVANITDTIRFSVQYSNWCEYLIDAKIGYPIRAFNVIAVFGIELTMLSFCIERSVAVFYYTKYEKSTSKLPAYIMIIFQIIISIWSAIGFNIAYTDFNTKTVLIQLRTSTNLSQIKIIPYLHFTYGLTSLIVLHGLLIINNVRIYRCTHNVIDNRNTKALRLGEKYQLQENRQSIRSILLLFWPTFILCNVNAIALFIRNVIWMTSEERIFLIYTDFFNNISIVLPFLVFAVMLSRFPKLRQKLNFWRSHKTHATMNAARKKTSKEDSEYFHYLQNQWTTASDQKRSSPMLKRFARVIHLAI